MELQVLSLLVLQKIVVDIWVLVQIDLQTWCRLVEGRILALHEIGLELLSHILTQGLLHLLPFQKLH